MTEQITFRLVSAIQYAFVDVTGTVEEINQINFEMLAALYANSLTAFQGAELKAAEVIYQQAEGKPAEAPSGPPSSDPVAAVKDELGATEIDDVNAPPWERPKAAKPKAWETERPAPKQAIDIDFF